jgi:hypothetical protein
MKAPKLRVKTFTNPVSLYNWLSSMTKKLAKTRVKVTGSTHVSNRTVAVPSIPRDRRHIRNAAAVNETPKTILRYIKTTKRAIETAKTSSGLNKLTLDASICRVSGKHASTTKT